MAWVIVLGGLGGACLWYLKRKEPLWGWGVAWVTLGYILFFHSNWVSERQSWEDRATVFFQTTLDQRADHHLAEWTTLIQEAKAQQAAWLAQCQREWWRLHPTFRPSTPPPGAPASPPPWPESVPLH